MAIYITETDAPRPYASSPRAVLFVDAAGNTVASWTPGDIDDHGTANLPDLGVFPLTLQATRAELAALDYVLTDEFPLDHPQDCLYCASGESSTHTYEPPAATFQTIGADGAVIDSTSAADASIETFKAYVGTCDQDGTVAQWLEGSRVVAEAGASFGLQVYGI